MNAKERKAVYGINKFTDLTEEEFTTQFLSPLQLRKPEEQKNHLKTFEQTVEKRFPQLPVSFDWRYHDAVSNVKNQGPCYSYWAFSAVDVRS
jgi:C1A family cysteine protease